MDHWAKPIPSSTRRSTRSARSRRRRARKGATLFTVRGRVPVLSINWPRFCWQPVQEESVERSPPILYLREERVRNRSLDCGGGSDVSPPSGHLEPVTELH